jgi:hypothetical protein
MRTRFASHWLLAGSSFVAAATLVLPVRPAVASVMEFPQDLAGFTAAAKTSDVAVTFDDIPANTDIGGRIAGGATFVAVGSPLIVVDQATTGSVGDYRQPFDADNKLTATSDDNVLSPGGAALPPGPDPNTENDDLELTFERPVGFFGFDHLSQQSDGTAYTRIEVLDTQDRDLFEGRIPIALLPVGEDGIVPGGTDFWGIVSDSNNIAKVIVNEFDFTANAPDNNIGYDSLRFGEVAAPPPPPAAIPLPTSLAGLPAAACAAAFASRHFRRG